MQTFEEIGQHAPKVFCKNQKWCTFKKTKTYISLKVGSPETNQISFRNWLRGGRPALSIWWSLLTMIHKVCPFNWYSFHCHCEAWFTHLHWGCIVLQFLINDVMVWFWTTLWAVIWAYYVAQHSKTSRNLFKICGEIKFLLSWNWAN